jgi:tetratricopeptide (TPR) repeat protein
LEEARLAAVRLEQERLALEARANAEPAVPPVEATEDGGQTTAPDAGEAELLAGGALPDGGAEDGGLAEADAGTDAGAALAEAGDAGPLLAEALPDAGAAPGETDAGVGQGALAVADAGMPDGGTALQGKRREPVLDFDGYMAQGDRLRDRNRPQAALNAYDKAVDLEPERAEPYAGRGLALLDMGSPGQAEADFKRALELNPRYGVALMGLAETYRTQGRKAEAIRYYERYLEVLPNGPEAAVARSAIERLKE